MPVSFYPYPFFISQFWRLPKILSSAAYSADILFNWIQNGGTPFRLRMRARTYICCVLSPTHGARWERRADGDDDCDGARQLLRALRLRLRLSIDLLIKS